MNMPLTWAVLASAKKKEARDAPLGTWVMGPYLVLGQWCQHQHHPRAC